MHVFSDVRLDNIILHPTPEKVPSLEFVRLLSRLRCAVFRLLKRCPSLSLLSVPPPVWSFLFFCFHLPNFSHLHLYFIHRSCFSVAPLSGQYSGLCTVAAKKKNKKKPHTFLSHEAMSRQMQYVFCCNSDWEQRKWQKERETYNNRGTVRRYWCPCDS